MADHTEIVARVKADLVARGIPLAGPCGAFEILRRVAYALRGDAWGFVAAPPGGEGCNGLRADKLVTHVGGLFVDCIGDAGGANTPAWQERSATPEELGAWRQIPLEDPDAQVAPPPPPPPPPPDPTESGLARLVVAAERGADALQTIAGVLTAISDHLGVLETKGIRVRL